MLAVQVTTESPVLQTDRAEVARSFENQEVIALPLTGRATEAIAGLLPAVAPPTTDAIALEDPMETTNYNANSQSIYANTRRANAARIGRQYPGATASSIGRPGQGHLRRPIRNS